MMRSPSWPVRARRWARRVMLRGQLAAQQLIASELAQRRRMLVAQADEAALLLPRLQADEALAAARVVELRAQLAAAPRPGAAR